MSTNPLQKYFRQPKLFISLPSKGLFYKEGTLAGDASNVPIFAMTGMDEIIMKTPDALFNGTSTIKLIESCCPYITDAASMPSLDVDALLVAIRMATFGEEMTISHTCSKCSTENEYSIKLPLVLEQYQNKTFKSQIEVDGLTVNIRPLTYAEVSHFGVENFKLQKTLYQLNEAPEDQKQQYLDQIYQGLAETQVDLFLTCIESIQTPEELVTSKEFIKEWLTHSVSTSYKKIKACLDENKTNWQMPTMPVTCTNEECGHVDSVEVVLDQSSFFG